MRRLKIDAWLRFGAPENVHVLNWVREGVKIPFHTIPAPVRLNNFIKSEVQARFVDEELARLVRVEAIRKCDNSEVPVYITPINCVPKKNNKYRSVLYCRYVVAVSDTYRNEISDGYFIRDRIYYGQHRIPGWHTYSGTLTQPNEIAFMCTTCEIPGCTALSVDHTHNFWVYSTLG